MILEFLPMTIIDRGQFKMLTIVPLYVDYDHFEIRVFDYSWNWQKQNWPRTWMAKFPIDDYWINLVWSWDISDFWVGFVEMKSDLILHNLKPYEQIWSESTILFTILLDNLNIRLKSLNDFFQDPQKVANAVKYIEKVNSNVQNNSYNSFQFS